MTSHRRPFLLGCAVLTTFLLAACAAPKRPFAERLPGLQGRALTVLTYEGKSIDVDRREFLGIFTGNIYSSAGARAAAQKNASANVMTTLRLQDPASAIGERVQAKAAELLKSDGTTRLADVAPSGLTFRSTDALSSAATRGLAIDVRTSYWRVTYLNKEGPPAYMFDYQGRARLYDAEGRAMIGESWCYYTSGDKPQSAPSFEQFMDNDGALLRKSIDAAIAACADELTTYLFQ